MKSTRVLVGDIIMSSLFKYGRKERPYQPITDVGCKDSGANAIDDLRILKKYVVVSAEIEYNSNSSSGWCVIARELTNEGGYNENGELIKFYQTGDFKNLIQEVDIVGKMAMSSIKQAKIKINDIINAQDIEDVYNKDISVPTIINGTVALPEQKSLSTPSSNTADVNPKEALLKVYKEQYIILQAWLSERTVGIDIPKEVAKAVKHYIKYELSLQIDKLNDYDL